MSDRLKAVWSGTPQWDAWLKHHRGSKSEARMLVCQAEVRPFFAPSEWPPETPRADRLTRNGFDHATRTPVDTLPIERRSLGDGELDEIADRLTARQERTDADGEQARLRTKTLTRSDAQREAALNAAANNERPNVADCDDLGTIEVVDPHEEAELEHVGRGQPMMRRRRNVPRQIRVVSLRNDPVGLMAKRHQLGDDHDEAVFRLRVARLYEATYAQAEIGGARGLDPMKDIVDGGMFVMPDTDARIKAQKRLAEFDRALGVDGVAIVRAVLVIKYDIKTLAEAYRGVPATPTAAARNVSYYSTRFQECLDRVGETAGLKPRPTRGRTPRDRFAKMDGMGAGNTALYTAIHRAKVIPR